MDITNPVVQNHIPEPGTGDGWNTDLPIEFLNDFDALPPISLEEVNRAISANPDAYKFDADATAQQFGSSASSLPTGNDATQGLGPMSTTSDAFKFDAETIAAPKFGQSSSSQPTDNGVVGLGIEGVSMDNDFNNNGLILNNDGMYVENNPSNMEVNSFNMHDNSFSMDNDYSNTENNFSNMANNPFTGTLDEALGAQTPGLYDFDPNTAYYPTFNSPPQQLGADLSQNHQGYRSQAHQDPFTESSSPFLQPNPVDYAAVGSPFVAKTPYILGDDDQEAVFDLGPPVDLTSPQDTSPAIGKGKKTSKTASQKSAAAAKTTASRAKGKGRARALSNITVDSDSDYEDTITAPTSTKSGRKRAASNTSAGPAAKKRNSGGIKKNAKSAATTAAATTPAAVPKTPAKSTGAAAKTTAAPAKNGKAPAAKSTVTDFTPTGVVRQRAPAKNRIHYSKPIPHCYDDCDKADKTMIDMRKEGKTWAEIKPVIAKLTNTSYGASTLPNRYERLLQNFTAIREDDKHLLTQAHTEIEKEFNDKKWELITQRLKDLGGEEYGVEMLQRGFKKMMREEGFDVDEGKMRGDVDFGGSEEGEETMESREDEEGYAEQQKGEVQGYGYEVEGMRAEDANAGAQDAEGDDVVMEEHY